MNHESSGGGASHSTEPARGSSSATDVSLREYMGERLHALDRHLTSEIDALRRETRLANSNAERAIEVAAHEASERLKAHNGLIDQMQEQAAHFSSRQSLDDYKDATEKRFNRIERFQAMIAGGLILTGAVGVSNLVRFWGG